MPIDDRAAGSDRWASPPDANDDRKWTVMVFMGAETDGDNAPLTDAARADIREMVAVGSGGKLSIFVQIHDGEEPRRYFIEKQGPRKLEVPSDQWAVANGNALTHFIRTSLMDRPDQHRPQDYSMLVLWGHAYDFAIGHARERDGTTDALDFVKLSEVFDRLQQNMKHSYGLAEPPKLDIVAFDACDVATVELACQLDRYANYLLGSQIGVPIPGWPYDRVLGRLRLPKGRLMGPAEFGSWAVRRYCESYAPIHRTVSLTLLDLKSAADLFARTEVLATALDLALDRGTDARSRVKQLFSRAQTADYKPFVDLADLCLNLVRESGDALVRAAAQELGDFLLAPRPDDDRFVGGSAEGWGQPFVMAHGRNACATAKLNGISIYAPHVALTNDFGPVERLYSAFEFVRETRWGRLVHGLARS